MKKAQYTVGFVPMTPFLLGWVSNHFAATAAQMVIYK